MHVVEGISDRVVALDHGIKIAEGSFDTVATNEKVIEAYLGLNDGVDEMSLLELTAVDTYYGQIHILQALSTPYRARASSSACSAATRPGKSTTLKTILGIVQAAQRLGAARRGGRDAAADELPDRARDRDRP